MIFDAAEDVIFVHDIETGAIVDVNQRIYDVFGYTPEEACRLALRRSPELTRLGL
jgi:PAS domain S-box-containing protein